MKARLVLSVLAVFTCWISLASALTEEEMMAEMQKCAICKHLAAKPELMKSMTWETHKIDNGMLCVSIVPKEQKSALEALNKEMKTAVEEVKTAAQQGKPVQVCDFCAGWGELLKAGAKDQQIMLSNGMIDMITSDDAAIVAKIHAEADKAIAMQKEMAAQQKTEL